ncbi:hypothetical protein MPH_01136 [Macrophomina phaseolina MS6]|uniref:Uncharacterized protein n=1 Tax=Macrophomina phaseolina (strain MS6) TaxID=1126212 RepID=K2S9K2_MACPH|nr:hypothetical protein MPH_01136 [Macrophomina phaseolina MS6]
MNQSRGQNSPGLDMRRSQNQRQGSGSGQFGMVPGSFGAPFGQGPQPGGVVTLSYQPFPFGFSSGQRLSRPSNHPYHGDPMQRSGSSSSDYGPVPRRPHTPSQRGYQRQQPGNLPPPRRPSPADSSHPHQVTAPVAGAAPSRGCNPPPCAPRSAPAASSAARFTANDFPSLGSQSSGPRPAAPPASRSQAADAQLAQQLSRASLGDRSGSRGGGRKKYVPLEGLSYTALASTTSHPKPTSLPPPRNGKGRGNPVFRLQLSDCYRGKVIYIDRLEGIDYSDHPAVIRSVDTSAETITFFKQSSFKKIGGFGQKYAMYKNRHQKRWHERQWVPIWDGVTPVQQGTPMLRLANGEKMGETGSYLDIHGDTTLGIDYFSKYSRHKQFPELFFPAAEIDKLEGYSEWYLEEDHKHREGTEERKRDLSQTDGPGDEFDFDDDFDPDYTG